MQLWEKGDDVTTKKLADFTSHFSFQISTVADYEKGAGVGFVLVNENATWSTNRAGESLGLFESVESGLSGNTNNQVVAVEFDIRHNSSNSIFSNDGRIGIDVNSLESKNHTIVPYGPFLFRRIANVLVVYNSATKNLSASLTFVGDYTSYHVSYVVDLTLVLPQRVRVGFAASTLVSIVAELHQIHSWNFTSSIEENFSMPATSPLGPPPTLTRSQGSNNVGLLIATAFAAIIITGVILYCMIRSRKVVDGTPLVESPFVPPPNDQPVTTRQSPNIEYSGPKTYSYLELSKATNKFDAKLKLGEGGFGDVYQGKLVRANSNEELVAVKRFKSGSGQGEKEYVSEINVISTLRHKNLVQLKGWCHENKGLLLVYEFMLNRSLDFHLFGKDMPVLPWLTRYKIVVDLASALQYLQDGCDPFVLHHDIKSSNIMLDSHFNAKLGDFGLARLTDQDQIFKTTVPAGTLGYLAPEVISSGKVSRASDMYSFGVVALEIATGRRPTNKSIQDPRKLNLVEWVRDLYGKGSILEAVDPRLNGEIDQDQARRLMILGLWCCYPDRGIRPSIKQVQALLNFEAPEPNLPPKIPTPTYFSPQMNTYMLSSNASMDTKLIRSSATTSHAYTSSSTTIISSSTNTLS